MDAAAGPSPWFVRAARIAETIQRGAAGHRPPHGQAWYGPGFGAAFGGGPGWQFPGGGRPRQRRGDVRLAVLTLLAEQPMHGYQIITELAERSGGVWRPSPGSVYPTLQQLEDEGLVTVAELGGRRTFTLTDEGRAEVARTSSGRRPPWEQAAEPDETAGVLQRRAAETMAAVTQIIASGTPEQAARAERVLADARRALYRVLAEDETEEGAS